MVARLVLAIFVLASVAACSAPRLGSAHYEGGDSLIHTSYEAANRLASSISRPPPGALLVATLVDINNLGRSSAFGRTVSEQVSAGLSRNGLSVMEMKYQGSVYIRQSQGELVLSRSVADVANQHQAQAVVAGTYSIGSDVVYVNLKVIRHADNVVLAGQDYILPLDNNIRRLLLR